MVAILLILAALLQTQSAAPPDVQEHVEAGRARLAEGREVAYRIRLLPVASFPSLPTAFAAQLEEKHCRIPQSYEARQPENVIRGSFEKKGTQDWAALCSAGGASTLYVFFASHPDQMVSLRHQPDSLWLGSETMNAYGSAWGIAERPALQIPQTKGAVADHSGIEDAFLEHSTTVHYFRDGAWLTLDTAN